ncbi:von Willebrand factor type A domain-containing protein [Thelonectria olida]|uniref:von Willebrand factor type A domain-containing protein n=1 Tax=Thelonectria olida TaxID=1576542 RepID=A0A9P8VNX4_9HYPO|nr:von Willebrand factor type A domain-containing protein [Thelonectria olida]
MPIALFPGIRYDAREPPPPDHDLGHIDGFDDQRHWYPRGHIGAIRRQHGNERGAAEVENHGQEPHQEGFLSPLSTSVKVQIIHDTAKFTVIQLFRNESCNIKQGTYQFPLPLDATVTGFDCRIGPNKIIRGKVKASEDSQYEFNEARRQGRAGGLMEQQTAEIFTITLANIPARTKMQAELSFMCFLKHRVVVDHQVFTLTVPTFIAPRYGDVPPGVRMLTRDSHLLSLSVDVLSAEDLISVKSETHAIGYNRGVGPTPCQTWDDFITNHDNDTASSRAATVELRDRLTSLDKDLVITIDTALSDNAEGPQACLETHPTLRSHQALMLTLPPELMTAAANSACDSEIIFLADRSGSMVDKIESLKSAMMFFIGGIPMDRPFNIWCFGSGYTALWPQSRRLNEASRQEAMAYVRNEFASDMGGTEILSALREICITSGGQRSMDIIVLTDGEVWSAPQTIDFVRSRWLISEGWVRFFALGIGGAVSHELVEGIAKAGGGYAEVITSASGGGWEDRVVAVLKAATTGHIGSLCMRLEWQREGNLEPAPKFKQSPNDVSKISPFLRNRIFLLFDSGEQLPKLKHVVLQVREPNGNTITKTMLPKRLRQSGTFIHKLAARALLGDLERGESWLHRGQHAYGGIAPSDSMIRAEAIQLGCKWSLVSRWTSVYAVEEEVTELNEEMEMEISVADDDLDDALLSRRGGQAAANLASGLLRSRAEAEESGTESDSSESSVGTCSVGQPETRDDSDADDDANNPGFDPNAGQDTDPNSGRGSQGHRQEDQPKESQAPSNMPQSRTQGQSRSLGALEAESEQLSDMRRHSQGWNPTPRPEYDAPRTSKVHSRFVFTGSLGPDLGVPAAGEKRPSDSHYPPKKHGRPPGGTRSVSSSGSAPLNHSHHITNYSGPRHSSSASRSSDRVTTLPISRIPAPPSPLVEPSNNPEPPYYPHMMSLSEDLPHSWSSSGLPGNSSLPEDTGTETLVGLNSSWSPLVAEPLPNSAQGIQPSFFGNDFETFSPPIGFSSPSAMSFNPVPDVSSFSFDWGPAPASAPIFNPPASTSLVQNVNQTAKTPDEVAAEQFIGQLLLVQSYDGRFVFSDNGSVKAALGLPFLVLVTRLRGKLNDFDPAVAIAIVALLEEQFSACRDLWVLMVRKAEDYITRCALGPIVEELRQEARQSVKVMGSLIKELKNGDAASETVLELEAAPTSEAVSGSSGSCTIDT